MVVEATSTAAAMVVEVVVVVVVLVVGMCMGMCVDVVGAGVVGGEVRLIRADFRSLLAAKSTWDVPGASQEPARSHGRAGK